MTKAEIIEVLCMAVYLIGFVLTFGHAFNRATVLHESKRMSEAEQRTYAAIPAALAWPLYWSAELQKETK